MSKKILTLFLLISLLCSSVLISAAGGDIEVNDPDVVKLTTENFDQFINQDLVLVEFYAPWCGHCKSLAPEYAEAATELKRNNPAIQIGKVDATVEGSLASRYGVNGYPTLKVFRNGKDYEYKAPGSAGRKTSGIVAYMKKQIRPAITLINTEKELESFIVSDAATRYAVVAFVSSEKPSQLQSSFALLANKLRDDFYFGKVIDNPELMRKFTKDSASEALVVFSYGEAIVYDGPAKQSSVEDFIKANSVPLVGEITEENSSLYSNRGLPIVKFVMKVDKNFGSKHMKYYTNRFKKIAEQFRDKVVVAVSDKNGQKYVAEQFNLGSEEEVSLVVENGQNKYKFEPEDDAKVGKVDVAAWAAFVEQVLSGKVANYVRSERAPKDNNGPVKIVTGQNFNEIVNDESKDVLIEFYAPWCGHCKSLEPKYNQLGEKLKKYQGLTVAKIDATANDFDREKWAVSGYPTIYFRAAGSSKPQKYEGNRELNDFETYLKANAKSLKKGKKKKKVVAQDDDDDDF
jgi:protein disulfide isomerase